MLTKLKLISCALITLLSLSACKSVPVAASCAPDSSQSAPSVLMDKSATTEPSLTQRFEDSLQTLRDKLDKAMR